MHVAEFKRCKGADCGIIKLIIYKEREHMSGTEENVLHVTDAGFEQEVIKRPEPVLVDFWAPWCGPCKMVGPVLESLALKHKGKLRVAKLNVDENKVIASELEVKSIPTMVLYKGGEIVDKVVGAVSLEELDRLVAKWI